MRHSNITLTVDIYGHMLPGAEADAVIGLVPFFAPPDFGEIVAQKTGTDDAPLKGGARNAHEKTRVSRESHASDTHGTAEILSPAGFEQPTDSPKKTRTSRKRGTESATLEGNFAGELKTVYAGWLPGHTLAKIADLVRDAARDGACVE